MHTRRRWIVVWSGCLPTASLPITPMSSESHAQRALGSSTAITMASAALHAPHGLPQITPGRGASSGCRRAAMLGSLGSPHTPSHEAMSTCLAQFSQLVAAAIALGTRIARPGLIATSYCSPARNSNLAWPVPTWPFRSSRRASLVRARGIIALAPPL